jgi:hypothetical protein
LGPYRQRTLFTLPQSLSTRAIKIVSEEELDEKVLEIDPSDIRPRLSKALSATSLSALNQLSDNTTRMLLSHLLPIADRDAANDRSTLVDSLTSQDPQMDIYTKKFTGGIMRVETFAPMGFNEIESTTAWEQSSNNETKRTMRQSYEQDKALYPLHDRERFNKSLRRLMSIRDDRDHDHNVTRSVRGFSLAPTHHTVLIKASLKEIVVSTSPRPLNHL